MHEFFCLYFSGSSAGLWSFQAHRQLTEVVIAKSSPIIGQSVKDANFRKRYSAVVLAGHRDGGRLTGKVGDIVIQAGDMLLIQTANRFAEAFRHTQDFSLVRSVDEFEPRQHDKAWLAGLIVTAMVVWLLLGSLLGGGSTWANPPVAAFAAILAMVLTRCMHWSDARNSINVQMLMTIALALGMGEAMRVSGSASILAGLVQHLGSNPLLIVVAVYLLTMVMTEMVSNSAVAAIMIPISIEIASTGQMDSRPLILAVTVAASLSFITPVGYQTNLMVMGPGGYRPADFLRCGLPLSVVVSVTALVMLKLIFGL